MNKPKSKIKRPKGLINFGNTCYINIILQALNFTPLLKEFLKLNQNADSLSSCLVEIFENLSGNQKTLNKKNMFRALQRFFQKIQSIGNVN